tara:strand:+ start:26215 stop:26442 length:228 start_codon:yes stop_codon:yes gene_type:complete
VKFKLLNPQDRYSDVMGVPVPEDHFLLDVFASFPRKQHTDLELNEQHTDLELNESTEVDISMGNETRHYVVERVE